MDEMDEEAKRARTQGPKTGANWAAFPDHCWDCALVWYWTKKALNRIMLIYIPTEVDDSELEKSRDFFLDFIVMRVLLLTETTLGLGVCLRKGLYHWPPNDPEGLNWIFSP